MIIALSGADQALFPELFEQSSRLRHRVFVEEMGWEDLRRPDGREFDQFDDEHAVHHFCIRDGVVVGYLRAFDLLCNTREIGVDEALAIGLVGERLGRGELMPAALDRARRLARKPADILRSVRQLLRSSTPISTRISVELQLFEQCLRSTTTRRRLALIGRHVSERDMDAVA